MTERHDHTAPVRSRTRSCAPWSPTSIPMRLVGAPPCFTSTWPLTSPAAGRAARARHASTVLLQFVPKLRYFGVPEATIQKILVDNPRRWLAYQPASA